MGPDAAALRSQGCRAEVVAVANRIGSRATVYVDAALPLTTDPDTALAPPDLLAFLETLADDDGMLPPWTQWWDDVGDLFPDDVTRATVEAGQPRLPLSYFRRRVAVPPGWASRACGYLGFGSTYAAELGFAREHGWPVTVLDGGHLHALHDPERVATEIRTLLARAVG